MSDDPTLMLSVSGMRGTIGGSLSPAVAARFAAAYADWLVETTGRDAPLVVVGRDSRPSGPMAEHAAVAGLIAAGCRVVTLGVVTTPGAALMIDHRGADGALVITASHNPIAWNGIKPLTRDGVAPPPEDAQQIIDRFHEQRGRAVGVDALHPTEHDETTSRVHTERILPHVDVEAIRSARPKVVVDSVCGAGGPETARLLEALGVEWVHIHAEPTGHFPHAPEPLAENLTGLGDAVREHAAAVGFAQDPDADRLALVDETGRYIGEEYTLALCAMHVLGRTPGPAVANLSTSRMIDDVAARRGVTAHRSPVGEANVAAAMRRTGAVIGGEGNGGVIWPKVGYVRDSLAGIALILELLAASGRTLSQLAGSIPAYAIRKRKVPIEPGMAERACHALQDTFDGASVDTQDGVRIDFDGRWVHVRPSNTEPILRIIAEAPDENTADRLIEQVRQAL